MAAESKTRFDKQSTISFTLPISCQICLGKVKQPVLCPNNHVFCSCCMEVWLQRNQQCPACRVDINPGNPIQQIRGGLNHTEDSNERLSNPQMRRARFELLYKEYEDEFEKMAADIHMLQTENDVLKSQLKKEGVRSVNNCGDFTHPNNVDANQMLVLTRKLQDAHKQYERIKQEFNKYKQENNKLKDENVNVNRENERLRVEIANRSPHRYGRYTVATLESKAEAYEKEIKQLNKALERSDKYIEDLEKELESYGHRKNSEKPKAVKDYSDFNRSISDTKSDVEASKRRLFSDKDGFSQKSDFDKTDPVQFALDLYKSSTKSINQENNAVSSTKTLQDKELVIRSESPGQKLGKSSLVINSPQKDRTPKKVQFDLYSQSGNNDSSTSSFDLEKPSPLSLTPSTSMGKLSLSDKNPSSAKKYLNFDENFSKSKPKIPEMTNGYVFAATTRDAISRSSLSQKVVLSDSDLGLDDTGAIKTELDELNISLTPELSDCMKLLNRAEKNVHVSKANGSKMAKNEVQVAGTNHFEYPLDEGVSSSDGNNYPFDSNLPQTSTISHSANNCMTNHYFHTPEPDYEITQTAPSTRNSVQSHQVYQRPGSSLGITQTVPSSRSFGQSNHVFERPGSALGILQSVPSYQKLGVGEHEHVPSFSSNNLTSHHQSSNNSHNSNVGEAYNLNHNISTIGLTDMVKRGQNILKTLDYPSNSAILLSSKSSLVPSNSSHFSSLYTSTSTNSKPHLTTDSGRSTSQSQSIHFANTQFSNGINSQSKPVHSANTQFSNGIYSQSQPSHSTNTQFSNSISSQPVPQYSVHSKPMINPNNLPNFDIPQSLIIPSPNLSAEFPSVKPTKSNSSMLFSSNSVKVPTLSNSSHFLSLTGTTSSAPIMPKSLFPENNASSSNHHQQQNFQTFSSLENCQASQSHYPPLTHTSTSAHPSTSAAAKRGGNSSPTGLSFSGTSNSDSFRLEAPAGNYSYVSNDLSSRASDSFLTEPKKRLFETDDEFDLTMSPIKTTRHY
ncbi:hypothetical protein SNE40_016530 [Patella caerulea]|uniref:RING-type domain-containing protein n=1 Tax=Patella caerulea TaxID=87958 RepID=A0AAN8JBP5_PATCE